MTHDEMIAVIQAHKEGKLVQCRTTFTDNIWEDTLAPVWNFELFDYRIKSQPREIFIDEYENGLHMSTARTYSTESISKHRLGYTFVRTIKFVEVIE